MRRHTKPKSCDIEYRVSISISIGIDIESIECWWVDQLLTITIHDDQTTNTILFYTLCLTVQAMFQEWRGNTQRENDRQDRWLFFELLEMSVRPQNTFLRFGGKTGFTIVFWREEAASGMMMIDDDDLLSLNYCRALALDPFPLCSTTFFRVI